jgi:hypothetical protein
MASNHDQQQDNTASESLMVVAIGLALLVTLVAGVGVLTHNAALGPQVGAIVSFKPGQPVASVLRAPVEAQVVHLADPTGSAGSCRLDPKVMAAGGGSLIVEGRRSGPNGDALVHWAGARTALSGDCGRSAELALNADKLTVLAAAAGGFGVNQKTLAMAPPIGGAGVGFVSSQVGTP